MPRLLATLCLASFVHAALGQVRIAHPIGCDILFPPRTAGSPSDDAEVTRITERWLATWYPTRARLDESRAKQIKQKTACLAWARAHVAELARDNAEFASTLDRYAGRPLPVTVQAYLGAAAAELLAARDHALQQQADLVRIHEIYDAQLKRLQSRPGWR